MVSIQGVLALALTFVAVSQAAPGAPAVYAADYHAYPKYSYAYGVKDALTGDHKEAHETRDGGVVKGSYSLLQPDGVYRTVNYVADPIHGFQAEVLNSPAPAIHAVKKVVAPAVIAAPVKAVGYAHGGFHDGYDGYGHGGYLAAAPIAKAPLGYAHGGHGAVVASPYVGHGHGYAAAAPVAAGYGHHAALGYAGHGYAGHGYAGQGYAGHGYAGNGFDGYAY